MNRDMTPGDRIREACESTGLTQSEVARRIGVKVQQLQEIMRGDVKRTKHFPAIAKALGVDVAWLTTGKGVAPPWASHTQEAQPPPEHEISAKLTALQTQIDRLESAMLERSEAQFPLVQSLRLRLAARHAREIGKPVSVEEIAKKTGLDPYHLDRALASWGHRGPPVAPICPQLNRTSSTSRGTL